MQDGTLTCKAFWKPQGGIWTHSIAFLETILISCHYLTRLTPRAYTHSLSHVRSTASWEGLWQQQTFVAGSLILKSKRSKSSGYVALLSFYQPVCLYIDSCRQAAQQMIGWCNWFRGVERGIKWGRATSRDASRSEGKRGERSVSWSTTSRDWVNTAGGYQSISDFWKLPAILRMRYRQLTQLFLLHINEIK